MLRIALHCLFFLSGAAALGYQLVWAKMFSTGLGHEMPAVLAIVCAFMIGMALGAVTLDRFIPRNARAGFWLGGLELTAGFWAVAVAGFIPRVNDMALSWIGISPDPFKHWSIAFSVPAIVLLPATMAIGATLPAMQKLLAALKPDKASVGSIYAANTLGAVAGTLLVPHVLMPAVGFSRSCWILAALNFVTGIAVWLISTRRSSKLETQAATGNVTRVPPRPLATLFFTGLLGIAYETAAVRVLAQVFKNTVFTYAAILSVFLLGTAAGAAAHHRWWRATDRRTTLSTLLCITSITCFAGILLMTQSQHHYSLLRRLGDSSGAVIVAELLTTLMVLLAPTFAMGATFSHLAEWMSHAKGEVGSAVGANTLGASLAPALCGVAMIPVLGSKWTLWSISIAYLTLLPARPSLKIMLVCFIASLATLPIDLRLVTLSPGARVLHYSEGTMASVAVIEEGNSRTLRVDNSFQMGGTAAADAEYRQAHIPLLLHPAPRRALFLGLGTGISFGAASLYPHLTADGAELLPEVVNAMRFFGPQNFAPDGQTNLTVHVADARRFVRDVTNRYDAVIGDVFHPYRDGAGALYTQEHFAAVRRALAPNGIFCQWIPLHQLDEETLRVIVRTFQKEFPAAEAWLLRFNVDVPVVGLIGGTGQTLRDANVVESLAHQPLLMNELKRLGLAESLRLFGHLLSDANDLKSFAGAGPVSTDNDQRVTFMAPRMAYQRKAKLYASLMSLLAASKTAELAAAHFSVADEQFARRVAAYVHARNVYLRGLINTAESREVDAVAAYIESARLSPDFTAGYAQCLSIASTIARSDPARARQILNDLIAAQPERRVARELLERLFPR